MRYVLPLLGLFFLSACTANRPNTLTTREKSDGWILLFDGHTTHGWHTYKAQTATNWQVVDGSLVLARTGGSLMTDGKYRNFILKLDWKVPPKGNSGVFYHAQEKEADLWYVSPEVQILDDLGHPVGKHSAGACYDLYVPTKDMRRPAGTWNHFTILCDDGHVTHYFNGQEVCDYQIGSEDWNQRVAQSKFKNYPEFATAKTGEIGLQDYGDRVEFRNIKIKPLR